MNASVFFDNFSLLANSPNGVQKLREMILQLAVQGKLLPQDPNDEPASVLIERVRAEMEDSLKKNSIQIEVKEDEFSYEIPESWYWTRLENIGIINPRNNVSDDLDASFTPMTLISEKYGEEVESEIRPWKDIKKGYTHFAENDVVMAKITPCYQNGKSAVMRNLINGIGAGTTELHVFRSVTEYVYPYYVLVYLKTPQFIETGITKMTGSAGQKRVPSNYFSLNPFPLPPIEEQKRIVAKVDQLMALCDELEALHQHRNESRVHLNNAAINRLLDACSVNEFNELWQLIYNNFDLLYDNLDNVATLRQTILQLAVMGKLLPQDPNDEPASVLLEKIKDEKERLVKEGKIKKFKPDSLDAGTSLYELPMGWQWTKLSDICNLITDGTHHTPTYVSQGVPFISVKDVSGGVIDLSNTRYISKEEHELLIKRCHPEFEDILLTKVGTTGIAKVVDIDIEFSIFVSIALLKYSKQYLYPYYLENLINSPFVKEQSERNTQGVGNKNLVLKYINNFDIPLPPLEEQKRIVAKVDQLMTLCDELEMRIRKSEEDGEKITNAVVSNLTAM